MTAPGRWGNRIRALVCGLVVLAGTLVLVSQGARAQDVPPSGSAVQEPKVGPPVADPAQPALPDAAPGDPSAPDPSSVAPSPVAPEPPAAEIDYAAWGKLAEQVETAVEDLTTPRQTLEAMRAEVVPWRAQFLTAQGTNAQRISTLQDQIAALGPPPSDGVVEAEELVLRRGQLNDQLARLQAPVIAADEAYRRADGIVRAIDSQLRARQASALLALLPSPLNPAHWPEGYEVAQTAVLALWHEVTLRWSLPNGKTQLLDRLPAVIGLFVSGLYLMLRGWMLIEQLIARYLAAERGRGYRVAALVLSLGEVVVPAIGAALFAASLHYTGLLGIGGTRLVSSLPQFVVAAFLIHWLGLRMFPRDDSPALLRLTPEQRREGRWIATLYGTLLAFDGLRTEMIGQEAISDAARAVLSFPGLLFAAVLLVRLGWLIQQDRAEDSKSGDAARFALQFLAFVARAAMVIGVVGATLAAIGYLSAAKALILPAMASLCLMAFLSILLVLISDIYILLTGKGNEAAESLVPVLLGFALVVASVPVFALIWGARLADLTEAWVKLKDGISIGDTRISPTNFLLFLLFFAAGYMLTKLLQGALRGSILPRTRLDKGGRNAVISGVGYIGIFLSALIAINAAGIDLSGLAFVAGGLSLGLGFGLQNIVSNFVSGLILLIERPISEGDWIEVSGVQGTVKTISVRSTRIQTFDRTDVIVPNTELVVGHVTNYTRFNLSGRLIVPVGVAYGSDSRKVERILLEIAEAQPLALLNPPPLVVFQGFGQDAMNFEIRVILRDINFTVSVRSEINHQIVKRFAEEGIEIPFAQSDITIRNAAQLGEALRGALAPSGPEKAPDEGV
jgi:potassium-dependent mechanosensitive channel